MSNPRLIAPQKFRLEMTGAQSTVPLGPVVSSTAPALFNRSWQVGGIAQIIIPLTVTGLNAVTPGTTASTTAAGAVAAVGAQTVALTSITGFSVGQSVLYDTGASAETVVITNISGANITATFGLTHLTGVAVVGLRSGATTVVTSTAVGLSQANVPGAVALFPNTIALGPNQSAVIMVSVSLITPSNVAPGSSPFFGLPYVRVFFNAIGLPSAQVVNGNTLTLTGPQTYTNPQVTISLPVYAPQSFSTQTVQLSVWAALFGAAT